MGIYMLIKNMKKINYTIGFIISLLVLYQPMQQNLENFFYEKKRIKYENFINNLLSKNKISFKNSKELPRALRPDFKGTHDFLMLHDPNTGTVPTERILDALNFAEEKRKSSSYKKRMSEVNWNERGPNKIGGRTRALLLDPNNSTKLWAAGVTGGLWYTDNIFGNPPTWNEVDGTWANLSVCSISADPNNNNVIYVGTGERMGIFSTSSRGLGMWKTTDGGATWTHLTSTQNFNYVTDIVVRDESGTSVVYAGVGGHYYEGQWHGSANTGLWRSVDGGSSWTQVMDTNSGGTIYEIMDLDLGSDNRLWAGSRTNVYGDGGGDVFYSDDGTTWTKMSFGVTATESPNRTILSVAPSDPNTVYAMIENGNTRKVGWIVKTTDGGSTWTRYTAGTTDPFPVDANGNVLGDANGQASYDLSLGVDPNDPNTVFAGELDIFKTTDGGSSWTQVSNAGGSVYPYMHVDQQNLKFINSNGIIFANDGGIYYTADAGNTINHKNDGYNVSQFYSVALHPNNGSEYVLGGTQDNGTWNISGSGIQSGQQRVGGDGGFTHIDQLDPSYQFTATVYNNIYRSTDGGSSWAYYASHEENDDDTGLFINPSTIDATNKVFYSAVNSTSILRIDDYRSSVANKTLMNVNLGSTASAFKISPHNNGVLFVGTVNGRVFKITDAHTSSYSVSEIGGSTMSGYISSIDIGKDDNQILTTISNYGVTSVWETISGGGSNGWFDVEGDLPDMPIRWGLYNRDNFNQVIVATELGTWVSDDIASSSITWNPSNDGLANVRTDMLTIRPSDGAIAAGTHGRGIFYSTGFTSTAPLNASFTSDKSSGTIPATITFNDRSTGNPISWSWDFGDGNNSNQQSPVHTYSSAGTYSVSLTISDGTNSDTELKTNHIFVTGIQDTLWEEGVETTLWSYGDGRRDIHNFYIYDADDDDNSFGQWYYYQEGGTYNGRYMVGMSGGGSSNHDWLITPELWLRTNSTNIFNFFEQPDTVDGETYEVLLSPTGGTSQSDFTVTLGNETADGASDSWTAKSYDLTSWAGSKVRIAIRYQDTNAEYLFFDGFSLTADRLSDSGNPLAPSGVYAEAKRIYDSTTETWSPSENEIAIYWNRNGESDLASYNVYASQTEDFTPESSTLLGQGVLGNILSEHYSPARTLTSSNGTVYTWLDTTYYYIQTFGVDSLLHAGLSQGEKWYYRVGAVDNDGNEAISNQVTYLLDSTGPSAGTFTIDNLSDNEYLGSTSEITVNVSDFSDNVGIEYYMMGIGTSDQDTSSDAVSYQNVGLTNLTLNNLALDDYTKYYVKVAAIDGGGNPSEVVINGFTTYSSMLGDYDNDSDVDVEDLNALVNAWPNVDIGPATGTAPWMIPTLDGDADIYDISVFTRNWQWTKAQGKTSELKEDIQLNPIDFPAELYGNQITIMLPDNITAGKFEIVNNENIYQFSINSSTNEDIIILENEDNINQLYEVEFGRLSKNQKELSIYIDGDIEVSTLQMNYQLFSKDGMAGNGTMQLGNPDIFQLYQNYPNPFNSQTTIKYDIPSLMVNVVPVEIYIYNTVGKLVKTIDEGDKSVGQHTVIWDGKNDDGENVSSGVYFYQLRTKVDGQSDYNKTMKMVLVR